MNDLKTLLGVGQPAILDGASKRFAAYVRVAAGDRLDDEAQSEQWGSLQAFAKQHEWQITHVYSDRGSGLTEERPGLQQMMTDARAGRFDAILMRDSARLFRRWALFVRYYAVLREELGIAVVFTSGHVGVSPHGEVVP